MRTQSRFVANHLTDRSKHIFEFFCFNSDLLSRPCYIYIIYTIMVQPFSRWTTRGVFFTVIIRGLVFYGWTPLPLSSGRFVVCTYFREHRIPCYSKVDEFMRFPPY